MTIQRPNCMKTLRQGSVSIPLSSAARSCADPRPASRVSGYQDPAGGHEEGAVANHRERPVSRDTALRVSCLPADSLHAVARAVVCRADADSPILRVTASLVDWAPGPWAWPSTPLAGCRDQARSRSTVPWLLRSGLSVACSRGPAAGSCRSAPLWGAASVGMACNPLDRRGFACRVGGRGSGDGVVSLRGRAPR
jgi:hypothetical protein